MTMPGLRAQGTMPLLAFTPRCDVAMRITKAFTLIEVALRIVESAKECAQLAQAERFDGIVVDVHLMDSGEALDLTACLRRANPYAGLFVISQGLNLDRCLRMFEAGVDDCIREPFCAAELAIRVRHSIRLRQAAFAVAGSECLSVLRCGDLELDLVHSRASRAGKSIELRPKEFQLLEYLMRNIDRIASRTMILEHVWDSSFEGLTDVVDVHIRALRSKIDGECSRKLIMTNRGIGYTLVSPAETPAQSRVD
jgi:DNA-binding response OmpR family regulator